MAGRWPRQCYYQRYYEKRKGKKLNLRRLLSVLKIKPIRLKEGGQGTSLVVQWLRLRLPMQAVRVPSLVGELRSHMPRSQKTKA